jgi:hypothetical protein
MIPLPVIVDQVGINRPSQGRLAEEDYLGQATLADAPDPAFGERVGLRHQLHPMRTMPRELFASLIRSIRPADVSFRW